MTDDSPSSRAALLAALEVHRYGRISLAIGAAVAVAVVLFFLGGVAGGRTDDPLWVYASLAFVVFVTTAMLAAAIMVGRRVLRLTVHPAAIVRRAATGGVVAGLLWLAGAVAVALGPGSPWAVIADVALPWAGLLTPFGLWAAYTRYKRTVRLPRVLAVAALGGLVAALVVADLAAFDLVGLLGDVGRPVDRGVVRLFAAGAASLMAAQTGIAILAVTGHATDVVGGALLAGPALVGLGAYALLPPGRPSLAALALGFGVAWLATGRRLRAVDSDNVPVGPDPLG